MVCETGGPVVEHEWAELVLAGAEDEPAITPLMAAFNEAEGITWRPEPMGAALRRVLGEPDLGLILVARARGSRDVVGYALATFGYVRLCNTNAVHLMVRPENERARSLYESCGFQVTPRIMMTKHLVSRAGWPG